MHAVLFLAGCLSLTAATSEKKIICYYAGGSNNISSIDPSLCTHLVYQYVKFRNNRIKSLNPAKDLPDNWGEDGYGRFNALRQKNPSLKTMISIASPREWVNECYRYFEIVAESASREGFVHAVVRFVKRWGFDGFEIDWSCHDRLVDEYLDNWAELHKALRARFDSEGLILSAVAYPDESYTPESHNIREISTYVDFISLVRFNFLRVVHLQTAIDAPLQARYNDSASDKTKSVEASVMYWLSRGVSSRKLIVGVSTTAWTWSVADANENGVGAAAKHLGYPGPRTHNPGNLAYIEVCVYHKSDGWRVVFDEERRAPYTFKGNEWVSYENVRSVREKGEFIARLNLGGAALSNMHHDDFTGTCGPRYPLLRTLNAVLRNGEPVPEESLPQVNDTSIIRNNGQCVRSGHMRDPNACGLTVCVSNTAGGYSKHHFECRPGNCHNPVIGTIHAESVDYNFLVES